MKAWGVYLGVAACSTTMVVDAEHLLSSLAKYKEMRRDASSNFERVHNFDILSPPTTNITNITVGDADASHDPIGLCHMMDLNRHSAFLPDGSRISFPNAWPLEATAALSLAYEHLNTGNGEVVQEVEGLNQRCRLRFTSEFQDTSGREGTALDRVIEAIGRNATRSVDPLPCAFTGPFGSSETIATAALTGQKGYPQMGGLATSTKLDDKQPFPLFGRVIASGSGLGPAAIEFLYHNLNVRHLGVIYVNDVIGLSFMDGVFQAAEEYPDFTIKSYSYAAEGVDNKDKDDRSIAIAVELLARTNFRFFFAIVDDNHYPEIIERAVEAGIAGTDVHNWFTSNPGIPLSFDGKEFDEESPVHRASVGITTFSIAGSIPGVGRYDQFYDSWSALGQSNETLQYLQSLLPAYPNDPGYAAMYRPDTFASIIPYTPILYDTAIAIGLAACAGGDVGQLDGTAHYKAILNTTFVGATGRVEFDPITGTRTPKSIVITQQNLVVRKAGEAGAASHMFVNVPTGLYAGGAWNQSMPLTFNDGTTKLPLDLPEPIIDYHYLGSGLRSVGMVMASIVVLSSIACAIWTGCKVNTRIVRASQPFFLRLICLGTALMGFSIVALGIDDEISDEHGCNIACMAFPWLLSLGWVFVFSALFTKTHRVYRVFNQPRFSRVTVTIADVMKPMALLLVVNIIVLSTMTVLSPLEWVRHFVANDEFGRPIESKGSCVSDNLIPYLITLAVVDLGTMVVAAYEAYKARNISLEFSESEGIGRAIGCIVVLASLGVPIVYIAEENNRAYYFVLSGILFVNCMAALSFIFLPKVFFRKKAAGSQMENIRSFFRQPSLKKLFRQLSTDKNIVPDSSSSDDTSGSSAFGAKVLDHPKLRADLVKRNRQLQEQLSLLEGIFVDCTDPDEIFDRYAKVRAELHGSKESLPIGDHVLVLEQAP